MGPIGMVPGFELAAVLILVGAGVAMLRRPHATNAWIVGTLLMVAAALLVLYVVAQLLAFGPLWWSAIAAAVVALVTVAAARWLYLNWRRPERRE